MGARAAPVLFFARAARPELTPQNHSTTPRSATILPHLDDIFVGVCSLIADVDNEVKNGTALFDRLLREIVTEAAADSAAGAQGAEVARRVVPLLRAHMGAVNPYVRQLLVGWITELDRVPGVDMLDHLGDLLEGLFDMLSDGNREVRGGRPP